MNWLFHIDPWPIVGWGILIYYGPGALITFINSLIHDYKQAMALLSHYLAYRRTRDTRIEVGQVWVNALGLPLSIVKEYENGTIDASSRKGAVITRETRESLSAMIRKYKLRLTDEKADIAKPAEVLH